MKRNDKERRLWVLNDEGLYNMWQFSRRGLYVWIRENRTIIDSAIDGVLNQKPNKYRFGYMQGRR